MKAYIYPAVISYDQDSEEYLASIYDLGLYAEGSSQEEAVNNIKSYLENYIYCAYTFKADINEPTDIEIVRKKFSGDHIELIEAKIDNISIKEI